MSEASNVQASIAHLVLAGTSVWALTAAPRQEFSYFGTFGNLLFHGGIGFFHFQNPKSGIAIGGCPPKGGLVETCCDLINNDLTEMFCTSCQATRLLALPCAVAHLYVLAGYSKVIPIAHVITGIIPFVLYLFGQRHQQLGYFVVVANIMSIFYLSMELKNDSGFVLTGASIFCFLFVNPRNPTYEMSYKCVYPLSLCLFVNCLITTAKDILASTSSGRRSWCR